MEKEIKKKRNIIMAVLFVSMCAAFLSGCSNKEVDYTLDETEATDTEQGKSSGLKQFTNMEKWTETFDVKESDGKNMEIQIDALPIVPKNDGMSVVEVCRVQLDAAYKEQLVKTLFADSEVLYTEQIDILGTAEDYAPVTDYEPKYYKGKFDGMTYSLSFSYTDFNDENDRSQPQDFLGRAMIHIDEMDDMNFSYEGNQYIYLTLIDENFYPKGITSGAYFCQEYSTKISDPNACDLTEEEARKRAETFLTNIGYPDFVYLDCDDAVWEEYEILEESESGISYKTLQTVKDGYVFTYGQEWESWISDGSPKVSKIRVTINDTGICNVMIMNPFDLVSVVENVGLLPYKSMQGIMRDELSENADIYFQYTEGDSISYRYMALRYYCMLDTSREGYFSYVPAWCLSENPSFGYDTDIIVNAVDGIPYGYEENGWFQ